MIAPVPILLYHSVCDDPTSGLAPYAVSRQQFAAHLDQLIALGFITLTVEELLRPGRAGWCCPNGRP